MRFFSLSCPCGKCDAPLVHGSMDQRGFIQHPHIPIFRSRIEAELALSEVKEHEVEHLPTIMEYEIKQV